MTDPSPAPAAPSLMLRETAEAPEIVARQLRPIRRHRQLGVRLRAAGRAFVVTCARGSSDKARRPTPNTSSDGAGTVVASVGRRHLGLGAGRL
jgi:fructoselysine-6-P-deglycase FrlB-like protein